MKLMRCPVNGWRPIQEFSYGGTFRPMPPPGECSDRQWGRLRLSSLRGRRGQKGVVVPTWPAASGSSPNGTTSTDEILRTYPYGEDHDHE